MSDDARNVVRDKEEQGGRPEGATKVDRTFQYRGEKGSEIVSARVVSHPLSYVAGSKESSKMEMYLQSNLNVRVKRVEMNMRNARIISEAGVFQASMGNIHFDRIKLAPSDMIKSFVAKKSGGEDETFFKQEIMGTGKVYLKDTTSYLKILQLEQDTTVVFEKGSFYALIGDFKLGITTDISASNLVLSSREKVLPSARGRGFVILESAVNTEELVTIKVTPNAPAVVDDDCVIARIGDISTVEEFSGGVVSSMLNKTGLVTKYQGYGYIIIAPSLLLYDTNLTEGMVKR